MRRVLVVGASSVIVKHCCRLWANEMPTHFLLVGRNADKLNQVAAELTSSTTQTSTEVIVTDLIDVHEISRVTHLSFAKHIDIAIVAHGYLPIHMDATQDLHLAQKT